MDLLPPRWLDISDEISSLLTDISVRMKSLEHLHARHVLPGFDDESVKAKEERDIEALTQAITRGFTTCQARIRRVDVMLREQGGKLTRADETLARNLQIALATRVGDLSAVFRKKQAAYLKKLRVLSGLASPNASDNMGNGGTGNGSVGTALQQTQNPYTDPAMLESESDRCSAQSTLQQQQFTLQRRRAIPDAAIAQREREIEKIAQGVIDLSNIFQELSSMVIDQGTVLDRIDYNVERTAEHTQAAEKELNVATGYQKKGTKRKVIFLLVLIVVGLFILLLVKPKSKAGDSVDVPPPLGEVLPPTPPEGGLPPVRRIIGAVDARYDGLSSLGKWEWKQRRRRHAALP